MKSDECVFVQEGRAWREPLVADSAHESTARVQTEPNGHLTESGGGGGANLLTLLLGSAVVVTALGEVLEQGVATREFHGAYPAEALCLLLDHRSLGRGVDRDDLLRHLAVVLLLVERFPSQSLVLFAETALELVLISVREASRAQEQGHATDRAALLPSILVPRGAAAAAPPEDRRRSCDFIGDDYLRLQNHFLLVVSVVLLLVAILVALSVSRGPRA
jgi:hypothetical protein